MPEVAQLRSLIVSAFESAFAAGKPDWWRMQTGVLKNRILQATERRFAEADFGYSSFSALVEGVPDLLRPIAGSQPPSVELNESIRSTIARAEASPLPSAVSGRLRSDLWRSVLDYSNADGWTWDADLGIAVPSRGQSSGLSMPTIDAGILSGWRGEFAAGLDAEAGALDAVATWVTHALPTAALPKSLQSSWNAFLKARCLERLTRWFEAHGIPLPPDSLELVPAHSKHPGQTGADLRRYLHACIDAMTDEEVRTLAIPVGVALRVRQ